MKKVLSLILALAMVFALAACGEKQPSNDGNTDGDKPARGNVIMTFGTADTGGSMYPAGAAVSQVWTNNVQGVKCNTQTSTGSFQNCQDVSTGEVDVAVATSDVVLNAYNGTGKFADIGKLDNLRVIGAVYTSVLSGVALKSSGLTYI
ncbi:MAG: TAXI family TRAP transporter solute-binding subunit, partial [Oscillospiraceae bacterium]|nr:TAXI family TRAP transporter solute-binding subunit [Oscillospiraceae bacterium]